MNIACPRNVPRNIHLRSSTCVRMVPFYYGNRAEYVLESPQCDSVDENQAVSFEKASLFYIISVIAVQPYWVLEIYANFTYFNNINRVFEWSRPLEPLFRYPSLLSYT